MKNQHLTALRVDPEKYAAIFGGKTDNFFNSVEFTLLNSDKAERVEWLSFNDENDRPRAGLIYGLRHGEARAPFSAPYTFFTLPGKMSAARWTQLAAALTDCYHGSLTLPPLCYGENIQSASGALIAQGWKVDYADTNYHIDLRRNCGTKFSSKARGHLRKALKSGVRVSTADADCRKEVERAYRIIHINREGRGFPLRMSCEDVLNTIGLCGGSVYVASAGEVDLAAAIVFNVSPGIAQVIYWGDTREYPDLCGMYALADNIIHHLSARGYAMLDLGPSSSRGVIAPGQCHFKESVGGIMSMKLRLVPPEEPLV